MANLEIANGKSTTLNAMAGRIVKDQRQKIAELHKWTARHEPAPVARKVNPAQGIAMP